MPSDDIKKLSIDLANDAQPETDPSVITAQSLEETKNFDLVEDIPTAGTAGEQARFTEQVEQSDRFIQRQQQVTQEAEEEEEESFSQFINAQLNAPSRSDLEDRAFSKEGGVDDIERELDNINSEILSEQRALENTLRELDKNAGGGSSRS